MGGAALLRLLLLKLGLVTTLVAFASRTRKFVQRRLPDLTRPVPEAAICAVAADRRIPVTVGAPSDPPAVGALMPICDPGDTQTIPGSLGLNLDPVSLRPFVTAVTAELCIAASILATTALLVSRAPPT